MTSLADVDLQDHDALLQSIWYALAQSTSTTSNPLRTPTLGTVGLDGSARLRTVILRDADAVSRELRAYVDARSPKVAELRRDPRATWHFYDADAACQLRIDSNATLHVQDELTARLWPGVPESNRLNYRSLLAPGMPLESGVAQTTSSRDGYEQFAVVVGRVSSIDFLRLKRAGHERCRFDIAADGTIQSRRLTP
jgi:pyridoxamine 5'-phosphate oxidase